MALVVARGDIWMYRFARPDKRRPVLVLSRPAALARIRTAIVAPVTTSIHGLPSEVRVGPGEGLKHESVVNLDHIYTVPQSELTHYVGHLADARMTMVCVAIGIATGCR